jgi:hypothetical protein
VQAGDGTVFMLSASESKCRKMGKRGGGDCDTDALKNVRAAG